MPEPTYPVSAFNPVSVELTSPGTQNGRPFYLVDFVEADGARAGMWDGLDLDEARQAARECGDCGDGATLPVLDLTGSEPVEMPAGTLH